MQTFQSENQPGDVRLNKYISDAGVCSRREADRLITEGRVQIDGTDEHDPKVYEKAAENFQMFQDKGWLVQDEKDGGRKIRLLVDFEIRGLGDFQLLADLQDHKISMELGVPKNLSAGAGEIQAKLQEICTRNGMRVKMMQVQERKAHYRLLDVFPKIRKKENGINVSV